MKTPDEIKKGAKCCFGCKHYLGSGLCGINLELECADSEYEAYEPKYGGTENAGSKMWKCILHL